VPKLIAKGLTTITGLEIEVTFRVTGIVIEELTGSLLLMVRFVL